jgi:DNA-binding Lrp family transcriptional regulator
LIQGSFSIKPYLPEPVDSKDFRLLVALHENARQSYRSLGQRVSLSAPAVRDRLKRLEDHGILQGYWLYVDPAAFDRQDLMVFYRGDWKREDAFKALKVEDVAFVTLKLDGGLSVQTWPRDRSGPVKELTSLLGVRPLGQTRTEPQIKRKLSAADWRIMDTLVDDPTIPFEALTDKTGLSPKTVRKHLQSMIDDEIVFIMPRLGSLSDSGEVVYHLSVTGKARLSELREVLGEVFLVGDTQDPPMKYLLCRANDLADVTNRNRAAKKLPGVESVEVSLNRELLVAKDFFHSLIREKIQEWENTHLKSGAGS